ncbi:hypothetical protein F7725_011304 [Dissostichus mawsoni]|uniref:UBC core domain-containing protein n=1 Tax=Dissostichus mawsoni TaxID=36200 RepID=A0A7J5Z953_DISMA|nr:hypothetical protein F7725_011304 [Dissostichus mawsoni]
MAYDLSHHRSLKFDSLVNILHTFTENLETFKEHMRNIEASGCTLLYDALTGASELEESHLTSPLPPGGCCFKPKTTKDGLKLFEIETVLSLEQRKLKETLDPSSISKKIKESWKRTLLEKDKRVLEELKSLHCNPHPFFRVFPSESDFTFWRILMQGPPDTPYKKGVFELYCQFGPDYPAKPPLVHFGTPVSCQNANN